MAKNMLKKICAVLLIALIFIPKGVVALAFSVNTVDFNTEGSISITLLDTEKHLPVSEASFSLYRIADVSIIDSNLFYIFTHGFSKCNLSLDDLNADGLPEQLAAYAVENSLPGTFDITDDKGYLKFPNLKPGVYLVVQTGASGSYYLSSPFLVSIPMTSSDGASWIYDIEAAPKAELIEDSDVPLSPGMPISITVVKEWKGYDKDRPEAVEVQLLNGSNIVDTVTLGEWNEWSYTWKELAPNGKWQVKERAVPKGFVVSYSANGNTITITNTSTLIQTGQLNWPIPVLASLGLIIFALGWALRFLKRSNSHA